MDNNYHNIPIKTAKENLLNKGFELFGNFFVAQTDGLSIMIPFKFVKDFIVETPSPGFKKNTKKITYLSPEQFEDFLKCKMTKDEYSNKIKLVKKHLDLIHNNS